MRRGMVIDLKRCIGCYACQLACKAEHGTPPGVFFARVLKQEEGAYPSVRQLFLPVLCNHCEEAPCVDACPTGASFKWEDGIVDIDHDKCVGCKTCMVACPYSAKYFNWRRYQQEGPGQNPDVSVRPKGVVEKCTFCHHRLQNARERASAEGRELAAGDYVPACAEVCPTRAMVFGDLGDPASEVSRLARSPRAFRLLEELGTRPKVVSLREERKEEAVS